MMTPPLDTRPALLYALGAIVACGRQGGIGYGTGLCGLYVDGDGLLAPRMRDTIPFPSRITSSPSFLPGIPGNVPVTLLGLPLG